MLAFELIFLLGSKTQGRRDKEQMIKREFYLKSQRRKGKVDRIRILTSRRFSNDVKVKRPGPITDLDK